ncbi:hypothetical protein HpBT336_14300 [Helicobacter pylori]
MLYYLEHGLRGFLKADTKIVANTLGGLSAYNGYITQEGIAKTFNLAFKSPLEVLKEL